MKKLLIATAAMALVAGAQAQSSVTVYGNIDVNFQSQDNDAGATASAMGSGNLSSSRLGFKGTEDLGGGLKANFVLESAISAPLGQAGTTQTSTDAATVFDRAAYVSLESAKFGELRLGRQDVTYANDIDSGVSQMGNLGNFGTAIGGAAGLGKDKANATVYLSPVVAGFQLQAGYASADVVESTGIITETSTGATTAYLLKYSQGPLTAYAAKQEEKAIADADNKKETIYGASYDAGFASFGVAFQSGEVAASKSKQSNYTVAVPVAALGSGVKLHAGYMVNSDDDTANADATSTKLAITKALSKRTTVYAAYLSTDFDSAYATAALQNKTVKTTVLGVNHSF